MKTIGFSLIELLITLAIIGILAVIIYPNYTSHIQKSHCEVAKIKLVQLAGLLEEYNLENHSYENASFTNLKFAGNDDYYHYEMKLSADDYLLSAIPKNNDSSGILTYNHSGEFNKSDDIICVP